MSEDALAMTRARPARTLLLAALVGATALVPRSARAQRGIDTELFRPALDSYGIFSVERAQTSHQWDFGFKVYANYAHQPLRLDFFDANANAPRRKTAIDYQAALNFGLHLGFTDWLEIAIDFPVSAQSYTDAYGKYGSAGDATLSRTGFYAADRFTNVPPPDAAPLDTRLALKARLFRRGVFGMALAATVTIPFGDETAFLGDANFTFRPLLIADISRGPLTIAVNAGAIIREHTTVYDPHDVALQVPKPRVLLDVGDELTWSAGIAYRFVQWVGLAAEAYGYVPLVGISGVTRDYTGDVLGGLQIFPARDVALGVGAGANVFGDARRHDAFRVFFGLSWAPAEKGAVSPNAVDSDNDGVPDSQDLCPTQPEDHDGFQDEDGCPDLDNDGDGIPDRVDLCPNEAEDRDGYQDNDGCPDTDNDGDGVPDAQDKCPNDPEDRDGFQDDDGCPDADNDGDGIPDVTDKCPNEPETRNGVDDDDGCPDSGGVAAPIGLKLELTERVGFDPGKSALSKKTEADLDKVAEKLKANPQAKRIRIEGHTDKLEAGPKRAAALSQARADAVREYLVKRGIEGERLQAVGYGEARPLDKRNTADARAKNRRVEFIVVEQ
jgi:outer membrane protein OmpA-like peptidoglycan-associated protein